MGAAVRFICTGNHPVAGCGKALTDEEREYYESCCEECARAWSDTMSAWRRGEKNAELDAMFDAKPTMQ